MDIENPPAASFDRLDAEPRAGDDDERSKISLVLVNGSETSVQAPRARALFDEGTPIGYKKKGRFGSIGEVWSALASVRRGNVYCIDLGIPIAPLAALRKTLRPNVGLIYELGDPIRPLMINSGRPFAEVAIAHAMDRRLSRSADRLVFRGFYLADYFARIDRRPLPPWAWIPDGVDVDRFRPMRDDPKVTELKARLGLEGRFVVGILGNIHFSPLLNLFYGWDLAEALALIPPDRPISGVVVGDGDGRAVLEAARDRLGLGERLRIVGRVPHDEVPVWMNLFDVALSTQTDDPVGWGRTTAKLPEYLACGTPVICTDVGEAHRRLAESGQTLPYQGLRDDSYPKRLAERLVEWLSRDLSALRTYNRELALSIFDYRVLKRRLNEFLAQ